jgi:exodeoxyribonuclease-3
VSWNVNGLRACASKGFAKWLANSGAEIAGVQEVRALRDELPEEVCAPSGWHTWFSAAVKRGYSGVGLFARREADIVETSLGEERFDSEGRVQIARFGRLVIVNGYFPKGSGNERDNSRVPYKLEFYRRCSSASSACAARDGACS